MHIATQQILLLCLAAFAAGFVDAIVGGGGLIQTPAALVVLARFPVVNAMGVTKIPSFCGTSVAAMQYLKKVTIDHGLAVIMCVIAFFASFGGSQLLTVVSNHFMKPILLIVLVVVTVYTLFKKDF